MKKVFTVLIIIFSIALSAISSIAQTPTATNTYDPNIIPMSPTAASLGKFGNIPVNYYTGMPQVSIPIYDIKLKDYELPISLSYHYNGFKPEEYPASTGLGWTLQATGVINRQIRGLPDEGAKGYFSEGNFVTNGLIPELGAGLSESSANLGLLQGIGDGVVDGQPDFFMINLPTMNAQFFFSDVSSVSSHIITVPEQHLIIKLSIDNESRVITGFTIIDSKGIQYYFNDMEERQSTGSESPTGIDYSFYPVSWFLSKIKTPDNDSIVFKYDDHNWIDVPPTITETRSIGIGSTIVNTYDENIVDAKVKDMVLSEIDFPQGKIFFDQGANRPDAYKKSSTDSVPKSLAGIRVLNLLNDTVSHYIFNYTTSGVLMLNQLQQVAGNDSISPYSFHYISDDTARTFVNNGKITAIDHWGYYNNDPSNTLLPPFPDGNILVDGNERTPNPAAAKAGLLNIIHYPTGGKTVFDYEPNDYYSAITTDPSLCIGVDSTLENLSTRTSLSHYFYFPNSGNCVSLSYNLTLGNDRTGESKIQLTDSATGKTIFDKDIFVDENQGTYLAHTSDSLIDNLPRGHTYLVRITITNSIPGDTGSADLHISVKVPSSHSASGLANFQGGGLRVKRISDYASDNAVPIIKKFLYRQFNDSTASSGRIGGLPTYHYATTDYLWQNSEHGDGTFITVIAMNVYTSSSIVPIPVSSSSFVGYGNVTELMGENGEFGKKNYFFSTIADFPDVGGVGFHPYAYPSSPDWKRGLLQEEQDFRRVDTGFALQNQIDKSYKESPTNFYQQFIGIVGARLYGNVLPPIPVSGTYGILNRFYKFFPYFSFSDWWQLSQEKQKIFSNGPGSNDSIVSVTSYDYDSVNFQPSRITTFNSKKDTLIKHFIYPDNNSQFSDLPTTEQTVITSMPDITTPVITADSIDSRAVSKVRTHFQNFLSITQPSSIESSKGNDPYTNEINFDKYDARGNLLETSLHGLITSYVYAYQNNYPVAKVLNASQATISQYINIAAINAMTDGNQIAATLNTLRTIPRAMVYTYTYNPLVGITKQIDPNGRITYYEYDDFNRLKLIRDQDSNIIKTFCYDYAGQPTNCNGNVFYSVAHSQTFVRDNCGSGYLPDSVTYTVSDSAFLSVNSQAEADSMALASISANGQHYADSIGTCTAIYYNVADSESFIKNNCGGDSTGDTVVYRVSANMHSSFISQAVADSLAAADIATNGQAYANSHGTCSFICSSSNCSGNNHRCISNSCETQSLQLLDRTYSPETDKCTSTYGYIFSDSTTVVDHTVVTDGICSE